MAPTRIGFVLLALLALASSAPSARAADACDPRDDLVAFPYTDQLRPCLELLRAGLGRREPVDRPFVRRLLERVLKTRPRDLERKASLGLVPGIAIADIVMLLEDGALLDELVDFVWVTRGPGEEERQRALARVYLLRAPELLVLFEKRGEAQQKTLVDGLAKGLAAQLWPNLTPKNAPRLLVGPSWELLSDEHPQHKLAERVQDAVLEELD